LSFSGRFGPVRSSTFVVGGGVVKGHVAKRQWNTKSGRKTGWYVVLDIGRDLDGKRRQKWHGGFATRAEAEAGRVALVAEFGAGTYTEPSAVTLDEWVTGGWWRLLQDRVKPSTAASYEANLRHHVLPSLGRVRLTSLRAEHLNRLYIDLLKDGRIDGQGGLSAHTVRNVHVIVHLLLRDACAAGLISRNVAELATPPPRRSPRTAPMRFWQPHQLRLFLSAVSGEHLEAAWHLAALTGMRRGEIAALRWDDIDVTNQRVYIRQTRSRIGTEMAISTPKSGYGRLIEIDTETTRRLVEHGERQSLAAGRLGAVNPDRFLFLKPDFAPVRPDYLSERFLLIGSHLGLPRIRFHDLRHTYATIALATGVPINVVSERLGHTNTSVTLNVYSHVMPGMGATAAQSIANYIIGNEEPSGVSEAAAKLTRDSQHGPWHRHLEQHRQTKQSDPTGQSLQAQPALATRVDDLTL
jgi:integrase